VEDVNSDYFCDEAVTVNAGAIGNNNPQMPEPGATSNSRRSVATRLMRSVKTAAVATRPLKSLVQANRRSGTTPSSTRELPLRRRADPT
jgi:hypothetical protein